MKKAYISIIALLVATVSFGQIDRSKMPAPGPAPKIDLGQTESFTLDNGLKVFVVENHKLPRVAFNLVLDVDPMLEKDKSGMADLAGDLLMKGTSNRTKDEINFEVDFIGANLNSSANGLFGSSLKKHQNKLLEIMADVVKNADFKEEELDKLKKQYISGLQTELDDPDAISRNVRRVLLYGKDHPYGEITTQKTIENVELADVKSYYQTFFKPNVSYLAVVGDVTMKEIKPLIQKYFADWKKGEVPTFTYPMPEMPKAPVMAFVNKPGAVQSVISVFNTVDLKPGSEDAIKAAVTNGILGGGFVSKLNLNLREEHAYTYGARSSISSDEIVGNFVASAKVRNEVTDSALTETLKEIMGMVSGKITQEELDAQKKYRSGTFAYSLENAQTKASFAINVDRYNMPADYYSNYLKNLDAVSLEDVKATAAKYIKPMNSYILVVGNKDEVADKLKKFSVTGQIEYFDAYGEKAVDKLEAAPAGVSAEGVLNDYFTAIGGKKTLEKVTSMTMKMSSSMQGMPLVMNVYKQNPDKLVTEITSSGAIIQKQVINGGKGKISGMQGNKDLSEEDIQDLGAELLIFPELEYLKEGYSLKLLGIDEVEDKKAYKVVMTDPNGDKKDLYFDVESKLLVKSSAVLEMQGQTFTEENLYSDYKTVGKIMVPHRTIQTTGPQVMDIKVESVSFNEKIDPSTFTIE